MRFGKIKMLLLATVAGLHMNASAGLLDADEFKNGKLAWLQLHETAGLSLNDFAAGVGGWNTRYRFATDAEIGGLLSGFGLPMGFADYSVQTESAVRFIFNLGGPFGTGTDVANPIAAGRGQGWSAYARLSDGDHGEPLSADCPAYVSCASSLVLAEPQDATLSLEYTGLFLVRRTANVPEPSTLALMGLSAALLAARRRKRQR